jgi:hypothetical protein
MGYPGFMKMESGSIEAARTPSLSESMPARRAQGNRATETSGRVAPAESLCDGKRGGAGVESAEGAVILFPGDERPVQRESMWGEEPGVTHGFFFLGLVYGRKIGICVHYAYTKQKGFQAETCEGLIFLAGQEGFEPPSPGFGVRCSNR